MLTLRDQLEYHEAHPSLTFLKYVNFIGLVIFINSSEKLKLKFKFL